MSPSLDPNREALGLSLKRHGERLAKQALELRQHLAAVVDFRVGRSIEALVGSAETLYDVGIDVLCGRARLRAEGEAAAPPPDPTPLITAIEAAAPPPDPTPLETEDDLDAVLEAESDADAEEDKEAVSFLSAFGLSDETLAKLDKAGFFYLDDLADSIDAGDLADDAPKLTEDEVDVVIAVVRKAGGNGNRGNAKSRERTRADYPVQPDAGQYTPPEPKAKKPRAGKPKAEAPDAGPWPFAVHPNGAKHPAYAVLAPSKMAAITYAKVHHERAEVKPDDGKLGLVVKATLDKTGAVVVPALQEVANG